MSAAISRDAGFATPQLRDGAQLMLAIARAMAETARGPDAAARPETMAWLFSLAARPGFRDALGGAIDAHILAPRLGRLLAAAGEGAFAGLLLATLRLLPLDPHGPGGGGHRLFEAALAILLHADTPDQAQLRQVLQGLGARADQSAAIGDRFLVLAVQLGLAIRLQAPVALLARLLGELATLARRGAAALADDLDTARAQELHVRARLNDPVVAMRTHSRVPHRSLAAVEGGNLRKEFIRNDGLAAETQDRLRRAAAGVVALGEDLARLEGLERVLLDAAAPLAAA